MKKLIISYTCYNWIYEFFDTITSDNNEYDIIIICSDSPSINYPKLCSDAIVAQRQFDLYKIGKKLKIKKITNLDYSEGLDIYRLVFQLNLYIGTSGIRTILCTNDKVLIDLLNKFEKIIVKTSDHICNIPDEIKELMVGE